MTDQSTTPKRKLKIPPLVWIVLALLVAWLVIAMMQRGGQGRTPQGVEYDVQAQGTSIMPPAPASGSAPATPGSVGTSPNPSTAPTQ